MKLGTALASVLGPNLFLSRMPVITVALSICCLIFCMVSASSIGWIPSEQEASFAGFLISATLSLAAIYGLAVTWTNGAVLDISKNEIAVYRGPLYVPMPRRKTLPTSKVAQLYVQEIQHRVAGRGEFLTSSLPSYALWALLQDGLAAPSCWTSGRRPVSCAGLET